MPRTITGSDMAASPPLRAAFRARLRVMTSTSTRFVLLAATALVLSCGGSESKPTDAAISDGPVADGSSSPDGTGGGSPDANLLDAIPADAVSTPDVSTVDAPVPDAMPSDECGAVGDSCGGACPDALICMSGAGGGVCVPNRPACGGFAGAMCGPAAPVCMYLTGADFGPCLTAAEAACVCATSPGTVVGCP